MEDLPKHETESGMSTPGATFLALAWVGALVNSALWAILSLTGREAWATPQLLVFFLVIACFIESVEKDRS